MCVTTPPIEWAIQEQITMFDPGMGAAHKARRGFQSVPAISMHKFFDTAMDAIIKANIDKINAHAHQEIAAVNAMVPHKKHLSS